MVSDGVLCRITVIVQRPAAEICIIGNDGGASPLRAALITDAR
jgi:hypothetical protein